MAKNDKLISAFLVSIGVFSSAQAMSYVKNMTEKEKAALSVVAENPSNILVCQGVESITNSDTVDDGGNQQKSA